MKDSIVIYKSKYGSSEKYAKWISDSLKCDLVDVSKVNPKDLNNYKTIIYGGGLYAGSISGVKIIKKSFNDIKDKNLILFTVGLTPSTNKSYYDELLKRNLSQEMLDNIKCFNFVGDLDYTSLGFIHKIMMAGLVKSIKRKDEKSEDEQFIVDTYGQKITESNKDSISPLLDYVNSL